MIFIYTTDATWFKSDPSHLQTISEKDKPLSRVSRGSGRESTTDISLLPPLNAFKGVGIQGRWISEQKYLVIQ